MAAALLQSLSTGTAITWNVWEGQILPLQSIGDYYSRLGANGEGSQSLGNVGPDCDITAHFLTNTLSQAIAVLGAIMGMQTQYVRVIEPDGTLWQRVLLKRAIGARRRGRYAYSGTLWSYRVEARLTLSTQL